MREENFTVLGSSILKGSTCNNSNVVIIDSVVTNCEFNGESPVIIIDSNISNCKFVSNKPTVIYESTVEDSYLSYDNTIRRSSIRYLYQHNIYVDSIFISDNAVLLFNGYTSYQNRSVILRNNLYKQFPNSVISSGGDIITDAPNKEVTVNCITNDYEKWLGRAGRKYGRLNGYTEEQMDEIDRLVRFIKRVDSER